ncbi:MAG: hypothetical protein WAJ86_13860, partial [Candidatus Acidiferrales bacterium]
MPTPPTTSVRAGKTLPRALRYVSLLLAILSCVLLAGVNWRAQAQQPKANEFQVKAAYLYN